MSSTATKPWMATGDVEDVVDEAPESSAAAPRSSFSTHSDVPPAESSLVLNPRWVFVPLAGAAILAMLAFMHRGPENGSGRAAMITALICVAGGLQLFSIMSGRRQVASLSEVVRGDVTHAVVRRDSWPVLTNDLAPLGQELFAHLDRLSDALRRNHEKGVELGYRLAETQHRNADAIIGSLQDGVLVVDAFDRILLSNAAAQSILDLPQNDSGRQSLAETIADATLLQVIRQAQRAPLECRRSLEHVIGGRTFKLAMTTVSASSAVPDQKDETGVAADVRTGEEPRMVVVILQDITQVKESAKVMNEFVSHVAHELRTPLSSLKAYVEMLTDDEAEDEHTRQEYFAIIQTETDRMSRLIDNILNISRIESGLVRVAKEPVALAVIVRDALDVMKPQAEMKKITLTDSLAPVMHSVLADRDMIYQSILNLVSNAVKYTPEGGSVQVRMRVNEQERTISTDVIDTGVGIPPEDLPKMFQKFFRVKANTKVAKGTGLGLNLVRNIVETVHGGKVGLTSTPGKGSTFTLTLPLL